MFQFSAGSFFQNNNSILVPLLEYVREAIFPSSTQSIATTEKGIAKIDPPTHLVDTYCGSGLFGISLSKHFDRIAGVEISDQSIKAAKLNAEMNGLTGKTSWLVGKAEEIFGGLEKEGFRGRESCVVVDVSDPIHLCRSRCIVMDNVQAISAGWCGSIVHVVVLPCAWA